MKKSFFIMCSMLFISLSVPAYALEKTTIEILTLPFGTASYASDMALESLFKEVKSPVSLVLKQTPGAMFISRYNFENKENMRSGKIPFTTSLTSAGIIPYMALGLPPYEDYPQPDARILCTIGGIVMPFVTFNSKIKTPADFAGKKVGVAEKARPNMSTLPNQPIFNKYYGGYDKISWQYLGFANSKDAILNGSIDIHFGNMSCKFEAAEDGSLFITKATPDPSLMEIISANKPFYFIPENYEYLKEGYDVTKDQQYWPVLIKAGTVAGVNEDIWVKGAATAYAIDKDMPDEVVEEIVYQIFKNRERLADYYDGFAYLSDSPYIASIDLKWYHPGMFKAMKRLGLPLPDGVTVD